MHWTLHKKIAFRWLFVYIVLSCSGLPAAGLWNGFVRWTGELLGVDAAYRVTGSGDTTFFYIQALCFVVMALAATLVWSLADHKRTHYHRLYLGLRVLVRLWLGTLLITYGAVKVIPTQFHPLPLDRLVQTFGDASPMGLLWSFMGASELFTILSGAGEMFAGILLFFHRTTTLGALVSIGVMSWVVALNFSYDVPVKLFSCHLLAMGGFLAAKDARRLANVLVLNRTAGPASMDTVLQRPGLRRAAFVAKMMLLGLVTVSSLYQSHSIRKKQSVTSPLDGIWEVQQFTLGGESPSPAVPDNVRWRRMIISGAGRFAWIQRMDGSRRQHSLTLDIEAKKLFLNGDLTYTTPAPDSLHLRGIFEGRNLSITMRHVDPSEFRLVNRGFRWISESPYNR